ncbi:MAG: hypothetical protein QG566_536 [Patescibacteria group bacterium]|jgi:hypothetical protein|nr:hypothetical protein [Patescibacteria group bacterium]
MYSKIFQVEKRYQSVLLVCNDLILRFPDVFTAFFNCTLMEKFDLSVCPAHQGGVLGEDVELINCEPLGLQNNLNHLSPKTKKILEYYERMLNKYLVYGITGCYMPYVLFDSKKKEYDNFFLNSSYLFKYFNLGLMELEAELDKNKSFDERQIFSKDVFKRLIIETEPSLMSPYLTGI